MTSEVKPEAPAPSLFDLPGHGLPARAGAILRPTRGLAGPRSSKWRDMMLDAQALADLYIAAWNEPDAAKRSSAIAALWEPDALAHSGRRECAPLSKLTLVSPAKNGR